MPGCQENGCGFRFSGSSQSVGQKGQELPKGPKPPEKKCASDSSKTVAPIFSKRRPGGAPWSGIDARGSRFSVSSISQGQKGQKLSFLAKNGQKQKCANDTSKTIASIFFKRRPGGAPWSGIDARGSRFSVRSRGQGQKGQKLPKMAIFPLEPMLNFE